MSGDCAQPEPLLADMKAVADGIFEALDGLFARPQWRPEWEIFLLQSIITNATDRMHRAQRRMAGIAEPEH